MSKFGGENKTFKAVQFLLNTKEAARRESNYDVRDLEYSDKLRNISVSGDIEDLYKGNLQVKIIRKTVELFNFKIKKQSDEKSSKISRVPKPVYFEMSKFCSRMKRSEQG